MAENECPNFAGLFTTKVIKSHVKLQVKFDAEKVNFDTDSRINPLSPNIHKQILQTDLYTFPYNLLGEIDKRSEIFSLWSFD